MSATQFTSEEWKTINDELDQNPGKYGVPERVYGSVIIGSFNIRKLGSPRNRSADTWEFLAKICRQFDLLAVQEIMDDLSGFHRLKELMGAEFGMIVSDKTGAFPGEAGVGERLGFIFRWSVVQRSEVVSDVSYDRSKVMEILFKNFDAIKQDVETYGKQLKAFKSGTRKSKPSKTLPEFMSFIRQPYCVSFKILGYPGTTPYKFMAVNAHLIYGKQQDRRQEFDAIMEWILARIKEGHKALYPNFILLGDLNLDYNDPNMDRNRIEKYLKTFDNASGGEVNVNFPFLDPHPKHGLLRTTARMTETFDQIGLFFCDDRFPEHTKNATMGQKPMGPDYGVFNFTDLFGNALLNKNYSDLTKPEKAALIKRYEHKVSDHMPLWLRLPLPTD